MANNNHKGAKALEVQNLCKEVKVHRSICLELQGFIDRILHIILAIESARPNCSLAIQALCSLHFTLDKAKSLIKHCSESSKLYLAMTSQRIVSRCDKIQNAFVSHLAQIQNAVPLSLAAEISEILHHIRVTKFYIEFAEVEARKVILALQEKNLTDSTCMENAELEAIQIATSRLEIRSSFLLMVEKEALKKQLDRVNDTNQKEKKLVHYLLYLLMRYGKFLIHHPQNESKSLQKHVMDEEICENQVIDSIDTKIGGLESSLSD